MLKIMYLIEMKSKPCIIISSLLVIVFLVVVVMLIVVNCTTEHEGDTIEISDFSGGTKHKQLYVAVSRLMPIHIGLVPVCIYIYV